MEQVDGATKCFSEVVVRDSDSLEKKTAAIRLAGPSKLQVFMYFFFSYIFWHYLPLPNVFVFVFGSSIPSFGIGNWSKN